MNKDDINSSVITTPAPLTTLMGDKKITPFDKENAEPQTQSLLVSDDSIKETVRVTAPSTGLVRQKSVKPPLPKKKNSTSKKPLSPAVGKYQISKHICYLYLLTRLIFWAWG